MEPALAEHKGVAWFTTTPLGFDWVYETFWVPAVGGLPGYWACRYKTIENPIFQRDPSLQRFIEQKRLELPDAIFRREYEADFVHFEGAIYAPAMPSQVLHTHEQVRAILPEWPMVNPSRVCLVGIDPGAADDHPFAALVVVVAEKGLICVGEYKEPTRPVFAHAAAIKRLTDRWRLKPIYVYDQHRLQDAIELSQHGIVAVPSESDVQAGIQRVRCWLEAKQLWFVESEVPKTIAEASTYRWAKSMHKDGQVGAKPKPFKKVDDLMDCLRYIVMHWPSLPHQVMPSTERPLEEIPASSRYIIARERAEREDLRRVEEHPLSDFYGHVEDYPETCLW